MIIDGFDKDKDHACASLEEAIHHLESAASALERHDLPSTKQIKNALEHVGLIWSGRMCIPMTEETDAVDWRNALKIDLKQAHQALTDAAHDAEYIKQKWTEHRIRTCIDEVRFIFVAEFFENMP